MTTHQSLIDALNRCNSDHFWQFNRSGTCPNFANYEDPKIFVKSAPGEYVPADVVLIEGIGIVIQPKEP